MPHKEENIDTEQNSESGKAIRLFTYLKELCALRSTQVRDVSSYDQVFWLNDLPRHKLCRSMVWHLVDQANLISEKQADQWIEIRKPSLKSPPELPDDLEPWVKDDELSNSALDEPGIYDRIPRHVLEVDDAEPNADISISDCPQIFEKWVTYLEAQWKPWATEDRELQKVQKAYNQLFNIYQRQEKLGEQYEVIIGAGLLTWRSPNSQDIKRHILEIQARIEFDRVRAVMSVGSVLDGSQPVIECGMLETADRPNPANLTDIENDARLLDGDPWERQGIESVLRGFVNSLPSSGEYVPLLSNIGGAIERPIIRLAPALILRKRTRRTFEDFYQQIIEQVSAGETVPENIRRIIEIVEDDYVGEDPGRDESAGTSTVEKDNELYFPLPANDEQRRIVQKVECRRGVLVQGPPGTGKSHTIANLISHFLAKGKRILVTSETPRALEVLRNKLPPEIEELCVVWLGSGPDSQKALEKSVLGITQRKANWNAVSEQALIEQHTTRLHEERKEQAILRHDLRACREADVYKHSNIFGHYSGTLQQIAVQIDQERTRLQWFTDRPDSLAEPTVTADELLAMMLTHQRLTADIIDQVKMPRFPIDQLIPNSEFRRLVEAEQRAHLAHKEAHDQRRYPGYDQLASLGRDKREAIKVMVEGVLATQDTFSKHFHSWAERVAREIAGGQDRVWRHIISATIDHAQNIESLIAVHGKIDVVGLSQKDLRLVSEHAEALKKHLEAGHRLGFWIIRARVVKDALYLIKSVTVNGKPCDNLMALNQLSAWINISTRITALYDLWMPITPPPTGDITLQCSAYRNLCEPIEQALVLHSKIEEIRKTCRDCSAIHFPAWHSQEDVRAFMKALDAMNLEEDFVTAQKVFTPLGEQLKVHVNADNNHASTAQLHHAVCQRDGDLYQAAHESLSSLHAWSDAYNYACDVHGRFQLCAPRVCASYDDSYCDSVWSERLVGFDDAWNWAKTDRWLDEMKDKDRPQRIHMALEQSVQLEREALKNLAAAKAWQHCMGNLRAKERMALIAWSLAVASIRSGTGKYAETHRETARQKLDECRKAIPAWVMPLYQVVQTTRPGRSQFDVVIIDEASQSGPEALFLNYIADKIIVVGDDKQITPMHVGVDRSSVEFLSRKHLSNIPHPETLSLSGSLFSQAELRFPDRIRLREHFRCMPEIIQFSNNLSYSNEPLIPLRQYGADRLDPVMTIFVKGGYRKGSSDDIENPPEAEAIVRKIADCCENPLYSGKTFGVICLKGGSRQADLITNMLVKEVGSAEMEKRKIVCGRPYDFQGDERDVIFLGLVDALSDGTIRCDMSNPDVQRRYNVAMSRAKDQVWLFHSMSLNDLRPGSYQHRLLEYCENPAVVTQTLPFDVAILDKHRRDVKSPAPFDSWFEIDVFMQIHGRGFRVLPQYEVANYRIDLVVEGMKGRLAVECDGDEWHGPDRYESDMARQRELERCGWVFWRVRGSDFYRDSANALQELWETLEAKKISPSYAWESDRKASEFAEAEAEPVVIAEAEKIDDTADDEVEDEGQVTATISESPSKRISRALELCHLRRHQSQDLPPLAIQNAIVQSLLKCPNRSCTLKSIASRVLKELGILTRGNPRIEFEKRVLRNVGALANKGILMEYKATNKRIRLLLENEQPEFL